MYQLYRAASMQGGRSYERNVRPSVRPSVKHVMWKNDRNVCQNL